MGNVAERALQTYRNTRVKLDDGTWGAIHNIRKQEQEEKQPRKKRKTQRHKTKSTTWKVTLMGEDGKTTPQEHTLTELTDAIKMIYKTEIRTETCKHTNMKIQPIARRRDWTNAYIQRPAETRKNTTGNTQNYHKQDKEHPGWEYVKDKQCMIVYTDGSYRKERASGTYAWIAGWPKI